MKKTLAFLAALVGASTAVADRPMIQRVTYGQRDSGDLVCDVCQPTDANGAAVLFIASGGWVSHPFESRRLFRRGNLFSRLSDAGFTVAVVWHRSAPKFKVPDAAADVRMAVRYLRSHADEYQLDANRFGAYGASAGGHLSLLLGVTEEETKDNVESDVSDRVQTVVAYYPPTDLRPLMVMRQVQNAFPALQFDSKFATAMSPLAHVTSDDAPTLFVHGTADRLVPIVSSGIMHSVMQAKNIPTKMITIEGAGHGFRGDADKTATDATLAWFEEHLLRDNVAGDTAVD